MRKPDAEKVAGTLDEALYERFAPTILTYLSRQVANLQDAEDVLLEVFLSAFKNAILADLSAERQLAWLRRVARNKVIDRYRHTSLLTLLPLDTALEIASADLTPEQYAEQREKYTHLYIALSRLSSAQQELLQLRYVHGLRFAEIARLFQKPEATIRQQLVRTLQQLRKLYDDPERGKE